MPTLEKHRMNQEKERLEEKERATLKEIAELESKVKQYQHEEEECGPDVILQGKINYYQEKINEESQHLIVIRFLLHKKHQPEQRRQNFLSRHGRPTNKPGGTNSKPISRNST